jgi:hypothetical protein
LYRIPGKSGKTGGSGSDEMPTGATMGADGNWLYDKSAPLGFTLADVKAKLQKLGADPDLIKTVFVGKLYTEIKPLKPLVVHDRQGDVRSEHCKRETKWETKVRYASTLLIFVPLLAIIGCCWSTSANRAGATPLVSVHSSREAKCAIASSCSVPPGNFFFMTLICV